MKTCVIVGQNMPDETSDKLVAMHDRTLIFEPLKDAIDACAVRYKGKNNVLLFRFACGESFYRKQINRYNRHGMSSSLGTITKQACELYSKFDLSLQTCEPVDVINLGEYIHSEIQEITTLKIDAQGMDLTILKTLEPMLERSSIEFIQCEADGEGFRHYDGLPSNSEEDFMAFMGQFPQYRFERVPNRHAFNPDLSWILT